LFFSLQRKPGPLSIRPQMSLVPRPRSPGPLPAPHQREIPTPASCLGLLCPATRLASPLRLLQELKALSSVPFGGGQVSPAGFTAGHAVHQPELMCSIIYSHRASPPCPAGVEASSAESSGNGLSAQRRWSRLAEGPGPCQPPASP
uniref:Uncharacterized protein n=1 Tax=Felis catus TaxID=9685 RepID=A0ABI7ZR73_FELCA